MRRRWFNSLLVLCALAFAAAVWGSVDCGRRLSAPYVAAEDATHLRRLIYFHFVLSQVAVVGACVLVYLQHARCKRYYLLVSYNEKGLPLNPPGIRMRADRVFRCSLHSLEAAELPPAGAPVLVYPMMMLSGVSSGERLEQALDAAYMARGIRPSLYYQPVLGASPWLAKAAAAYIRPLLAEDTAVLVVAHGSSLPEPPPEPQLFCRRLRKLLPGTEVSLGYINQQPDAETQLRRLQEHRVLLLPFLLTEGVHTSRDLPTPAMAATCGKELLRLPVVASLLHEAGNADAAPGVDSSRQLS